MPRPVKAVVGAARTDCAHPGMPATTDASDSGSTMAKTCDCGCGQPTPIAKQTDRKLGHIKGQHVRFIQWHHLRLLIPAKQPCTIDDCNRVQAARGWCSKHYSRWQNTGSPTALRGHPVAARPIRERLRERIDTTAAGGCWLWTGTLTDKGYGTVSYNAQTQYVHRLMYELERGTIPDGHEIDHLCRNRACCNPAHLEPVTGAENVRRGISPSTLFNRTGRCQRGHILAAVGVYVSPKGHRMCRGCIALRQARRARKRAA